MIKLSNKNYKTKYSIAKGNIGGRGLAISPPK